MDSHGTLDATRADAVAWADKAKASLSVIEQSELKDMLLDLLIMWSRASDKPQLNVQGLIHQSVCIAPSS